MKNAKTDGEKTQRRPLTPEQKKRRAERIRRQKRRQRMLVSICALLTVLIAVMLFFLISPGGEDPLVGTWTIDGVTTYAFYGERKGAMLLPTSEYPFKYTIKEDSVGIDFEEKNARDAEYVFTVQGNTLTLTGGSGASQGTYTLTKIS